MAPLAAALLLAATPGAARAEEGTPVASGRALDLGDGTIEYGFATGPLDVGRDEIVRSLQRAARAVYTYYGRFPVARVRVEFVPQRGDGGLHATTWGRPGGRSLVRVRVGQHLTSEALRQNWVLTHEVIHLAFPDQGTDHRWIEEGLATYVDPGAGGPARGHRAHAPSLAEPPSPLQAARPGVRPTAPEAVMLRPEGPDDEVRRRAPRGAISSEPMMSRWRKAAGVGLLFLMVGGLAAPAAAVFSSHACCTGMAPAAGGQDEGPAPCQWMTPTSCCDAAALAGAAAAFAPKPPAACFQTALPPIPQHHWIRPPVAAPTPQAAALSTIVLRL